MNKQPQQKQNVEKKTIHYYTIAYVGCINVPFFALASQWKKAENTGLIRETLYRISSDKLQDDATGPKLMSTPQTWTKVNIRRRKILNVFWSQNLNPFDYK